MKKRIDFNESSNKVSIKVDSPPLCNFIYLELPVIFYQQKKLYALSM